MPVPRVGFFSNAEITPGDLQRLVITPLSSSLEAVKTAMNLPGTNVNKKAKEDVFNRISTCGEKIQQVLSHPELLNNPALQDEARSEGIQDDEPSHDEHQVTPNFF